MPNPFGSQTVVQRIQAVLMDPCVGDWRLEKGPEAQNSLDSYLGK